MNIKNAIIVWPFYDAPEKYRRLSDNGGDEDWLAFVPSHINIPIWMDQGTSYGCCDVSEYSIRGGTIVIGSHS